MRKFKAFLLLNLVFVMILAACSSSDETSSTESNDDNNSGETVKIDFSLFTPENDIFSVLFREWAERIEEETEGRVKFEAYYSGQLSSLTDTLDSVKNGTIDGGMLSAGAISGEIASMGLLEPLGTFKSEEEFRNFYNESQSIMNEIFQEHGIQLTYWTPGTTQVFILNSDEIIKDPEQFKGKKFRTAGRWQSEQIELLGATPVNMDPSELYMALQNKLVDGTIQNVNLTYASKLHEVASDISLVHAPSNANLYVINSEVWNKISKNDQETIIKISNEIGLGSFSYFLEKEGEIIEAMKNEGAEVYELTEEETNVILDHFMQVEEKIMNEIDDFGKKLYEIKTQ